MKKSADSYFDSLESWKEELTALRTLLLSCPLDEELKWGSPCYSFEGTNLVILGTLKDCCVFSFFKGVLLTDEANILASPGKNTQSARIVKITNMNQVVSLKSTLKAYVYEAIEAEKSGLKVKFKKVSEFEVPEEFQQVLNKNKELDKAFHSLTPGRQRAYLLHFSQPKQSTTRQARIEKCIPKIIKGKGMNEQ
jgi:uncharacterized protein YdeI (YjbR/CyaY-like superfamily)